MAVKIELVLQQTLSSISVILSGSWDRQNKGTFIR